MANFTYRYCDGKHQWVPVGYFQTFHFEGGGPIEGSTNGGYRMGERVDEHYVVRACLHCPKVWYQKMKPEDIESDD